MDGVGRKKYKRVCQVNIAENFGNLVDSWFKANCRDELSIFTRCCYKLQKLGKAKKKALLSLFSYLNSPYVISNKKNNELNACAFSWDPYCEVAVHCYRLREKGQLNEADRLENLVGKLKSLSSCEVENTLHFLLLLNRNDGCRSRSQIISYGSMENLRTKYSTAYKESWIQDSDISDLRNDFYLEKERNFNFRFPEPFQKDLKVYETQKNNSELHNSSIFWLEPARESQYSKDTRTTLFSALTHSRTTNLDVTLKLPDLPSDPFESSLAHPSKKAIQFLSEDEGFTEVFVSSASSSDTGNDIENENKEEGRMLSLSIWDEALQLPPQKIRYWERFGPYNHRLDQSYLCEMGPLAFDHFCGTRMKEVQIVIGSKQSYRMVTQENLIRQTKNVLLGLPSAVFYFDRTTFSFTPHPNIRTSGLSPESLQSFLERFAAVGSAYQRVNKFAQHHSKNRIEMSGGLTLQAFIRGLEEYLFMYKETVISIEDLTNLSLLKIWALFSKQMKQIRVLADICLCSLAFNRPKNMPKPKFPTGLRLLSYMYELCSKNNSSDSYYMLLHLLKVTSAPFIRFVTNWLFHGFCNDPYGEFLIDVDDQYLFFRDKHYWTHGFKLKATQDNPPLFMGELAEDFFVCGKGINLLRLTCPKHYLFECKIKPPEVKLNFSMAHLNNVEDSSQSYGQKVLDFAEKRRQENLELAVEKEIEKKAHLAKRRYKIEELVRSVKEMEAKVKDAITERKRQELKMLKNEMEKAIEARRANQQKEKEEDLKILSDAEKVDQENDERMIRAREELIAYYAKLSYEAEKREKKALWMIARFELRGKRLEFLKEDAKALEAEEKAEEEKLAEVLERKAVSRKLAADWKIRRRELMAKREIFFGGFQSRSNDTPLPDDTDGILVEGEKRDMETIVSDFLPKTTEKVEKYSDPTAPQETVKPGQGILETLIEDFAVDLNPSEVGENSTKAGKHDDPYESDTQTLSVTEDNIPQTFVRRNDESVAKALLYPGSSTENVTTEATTHHEAHQFSKSVTSNEKDIKDLIYPDAYKPTSTSSQATYGIEPLRSQIECSRFSSTPESEGDEAKSLLYPESSGYIKVKNTGTESFKQSEPYGDHDVPKSVLIAGGKSQGNTVDFCFPETHGTCSRFMSTPQGEGDKAKELLFPQSSQNIDFISAEVARKSTIVESFERRKPFGDQGSMKSILCSDDSIKGNTVDFIGFKRKNLEPESKIKALLYPHVKEKKLMTDVESRPFTSDEIWMDHAVAPLRDSYLELDYEPQPDLYNNYIKGTVGIEKVRASDKAVDAVQNLPLEIIIERSLTIPIRAQITLVNRAVVDYFMEELEIKSHFEAFRKFLLLEDGEFGFALCNELFEKVASGILPKQLCTSYSMNQIVNKALSQSLCATKVEFSKQLTFSLKWLPDIFSTTDISVLDFLELKYKVPWPCNIVITETCISKYNKVFSFLLQLKKVNWVLQDVFRNLKRAGQDRKAALSPQLRQLQLFRHEMQHFVNNVERYLVIQILDISWQEFLQDLRTNVHNLDDIHRTHVDYLKNIIFRSLLTKNAAGVLDIITKIFSMILQFHAQLLAAPWRISATMGYKVHPSFAILRSTHTSFKQYAGFLFTVVSKLVQRGYQSHLDDFLLQIDFNGFYSSGDSQKKF